MCFPIECHFDVCRLLEGRLPSFIDGRVFFNPEHLFRIGATRKTRKNEEKKTFPNHGIFPMDSPIITIVVEWFKALNYLINVNS